MLKYSFSTREKTLIAVFAVIILALLWYVFVFQNIDNQVREVDAKIATAQDKIGIDSAKLAQQQSMQDAIERYQQSGANPVAVPKYDNIQNVMAQLNSVLAGTSNYSMTFEDITTNDAGNIERGVALTFGCSSYDQAVSVLTSLARGQYPCRIEDFTITGGSTGSSAGFSSSGAAYTVTAHLIYIESAS